MKRVVVTGLGAISPIGNDVDSFWNNAIAGKNGIDFLTRFDTSEHKVKIGAEVKGFDAQMYMDRNEVRKSDLYTQFAIVAASQAMEDSALAGQIDPFRLGVYMGSGTGGLMTLSSEMEKLLSVGPKRISPHFIPMMIANMGAGSIAIRFGAKGPCIPIVTACATGTNAIGEAYRAIQYGYADAIIAGGSEAAITSIGMAGFTNSLALTTTEDINAASIPFDKRRSGFVMGEGAGALILEEYEHAKQRGAKMYAEVCGYGTTCDAYHITAPDPDATGAVRAIAQAYEETGKNADPKKVYVNAHGTSTPLNDKTETLALKKVFGDQANTIHISSTKSMTGHMLGAAGAVEAIAAVLAIQHSIVPPTINLRERDPECDLNYTPNTAWQGEVDLALSISLGFGGHNACVAFQKTEG